MSKSQSKDSKKDNKEPTDSGINKKEELSLDCDLDNTDKKEEDERNESEVSGIIESCQASSDNIHDIGWQTLFSQDYYIYSLKCFGLKNLNKKLN